MVTIQSFLLSNPTIAEFCRRLVVFVAIGTGLHLSFAGAERLMEKREISNVLAELKSTDIDFSQPMSPGGVEIIWRGKGRHTGNEAYETSEAPACDNLCRAFLASGTAKWVRMAHWSEGNIKLFRAVGRNAGDRRRLIGPVFFRRKSPHCKQFDAVMSLNTDCVVLSQNRTAFPKYRVVLEDNYPYRGGHPLNYEHYIFPRQYMPHRVNGARRLRIFGRNLQGWELAFRQTEIRMFVTHETEGLLDGQPTRVILGDPPGKQIGYFNPIRLAKVLPHHGFSIPRSSERSRRQSMSAKDGTSARGRQVSCLFTLVRRSF